MRKNNSFKCTLRLEALENKQMLDGMGALEGATDIPADVAGDVQEDPTIDFEIAEEMGEIQTAYDVETHSATLSWNALENAVKYTVEMNTEEGWVLRAKTTEAEATLKEIYTGQTYEVRVFAYDAEGEVCGLTEGFISEELEKIDAGVEWSWDADTKLTTVTWDAQEGADSYKIRVYKNDQWIDYRKCGADTTATLGALNVGDIKSYRLCVMNADGTTIAVQDFNVAPGSDQVFVNYDVATRQAEISWGIHEGADSYKVRVFKNDVWMDCAYVPEGRSTTLTGLYVGQTYDFRLCDLDENGRVIATQDFQITPEYQEFDANFSRPAAKQLTWDAVEWGASYKVRVYKNGAWVDYKSTTDTSIALSSAIAQYENFRLCILDEAGTTLGVQDLA